jgi:hypothetical protein
MTLQKFPLLDEIMWENKELKSVSGKRGKFPGERRWIYAGAGRMRLARGGIFGPGMPRRAPMNS